MKKTKRCSVCKETKGIAAFWRDKSRADGYNPKCRPCEKLRMQDWHKRTIHKNAAYRYNKANKHKIRAHVVVNNLVKKGEIVASPCFFCGSLPTQAHHLIYAFPKHVIWVCPKHHSQIHVK